jgi:hypothetical protein
VFTESLFGFFLNFLNGVLSFIVFFKRKANFDTGPFWMPGFGMSYDAKFAS